VDHALGHAESPGCAVQPRPVLPGALQRTSGACSLVRPSSRRARAQQGRGVEKNAAEAKRWYNRAAARGHLKAKAYLAKETGLPTTGESKESRPTSAAKPMTVGGGGRRKSAMMEGGMESKKGAVTSETAQVEALFHKREWSKAFNVHAATRGARNATSPRTDHLRCAGHQRAPQGRPRHSAPLLHAGRHVPLRLGHARQRDGAGQALRPRRRHGRPLRPLCVAARAPAAAAAALRHVC
jgi:hypothetical protein